MKTRSWASTSSLALKTVWRNLRGSNMESESRVLGRFVRPGAVCLDIGGSYGRYAYYLSKLVDSKGRVFSFEPGLRSCKIFRFVKTFHNMKNVTLLHMALSDFEGQTTLFSPAKENEKVAMPLSYIGVKTDRPAEEQPVAVTTMDRWVDQQKLERLDFIKCDVEGSELNVWRGGLSTLKKFRPVILTEVIREHLARYGQTPEQVFDMFKSLNYRAYEFHQGRLAAADVFDHDANYFFIPAETPAAI